MLYRTQNLILQVVLLTCLGIIAGMVYHTFTTVSQGDLTISAKVEDVRAALPEASTLATKDSVVDIVTKADLKDGVLEIKEHIPLPHASGKCPTVEDIVSGVFPGRNTGITQAGKYFDIKSNGSYDLLSDYSAFDPEDPFPDESILDAPLRDANVKVGQNQIDNTIDGNYADTQRSASMQGSQSRMDDRTATQKDHYRNVGARMSQSLTDAERLAKVNKSRPSTVRSKGPTDVSGNVVTSAKAAETQAEKDARDDLNKKHMYA